MTEPEQPRPGDAETAPARSPRALTDAFGIALLLLLTAIVLPAFLPEGAATSAFVAVLSGVAVVVALSSSHVAGWQLAGAAAVAVLAAVAVATGDLTDVTALDAGAAIGYGLLLVLTPVAVLSRIARHRHITIRTVFGAVLVYVMIGVAFSFLFQALDRIDDAALLGASFGDRVSYTYYCFVTLTTLGYGDIVPGTDQARTLAILEALIGQVFLVVVVARVVGMMGHERRMPLDAEGD